MYRRPEVIRLPPCRSLPIGLGLGLGLVLGLGLGSGLRRHTRSAVAVRAG